MKVLSKSLLSLRSFHHLHIVKHVLLNGQMIGNLDTPVVPCDVTSVLFRAVFEKDLARSSCC